MKDPKKVSVSAFIAVSIIIVFVLFNVQVINAIPCGKSFKDVFASNFVHVDASHLMSNLYALYALSRVEEEMGFKPFMWLLIFLLMFNTLAEFIAKQIWSDKTCTIGFSGVLFGIATWELVSKKTLDVQMILAIIIMVVGPSMKGKNISLSGHAIGAVSGIVGGLLWKTINKD